MAIFAIAGALIGLLSSALPEGLKLWKDAKDKKHEIDLLNIQIEFAKLKQSQLVEELNIRADIEEQKILQQAAVTVPQPQLTGNKIVDAVLGLVNGIVNFVNGLVRPLVTYGFVGFYAYIKYAQMQIYTQAAVSGSGQWEAVYRVWGEEDMAVFATIIGHWFGSRTIKWAFDRYSTVKSNANNR